MVDHILLLAFHKCTRYSISVMCFKWSNAIKITNGSSFKLIHKSIVDLIIEILTTQNDFYYPSVSTTPVVIAVNPDEYHQAWQTRAIVHHRIIQV